MTSSWPRRLCQGLGATPALRRAQLICGAAAGPLFMGAFTAVGAARTGYDWRRYTVSSLAIGRRGWLQRANFIVVGVLYVCAAGGIRSSFRRQVGPCAVPALVAGVGVGLIGSGLFVTDPVGGFPPGTAGEERSANVIAARTSPTREGRLHNLFAIPIFAGIPIAGMTSAVAAVRYRDYGWACYSAGSSVAMVASFVLFGRAFGNGSYLGGKDGVFQRLSILAGLAWLTGLSLRAISAPTE